MSCGKFHHSTKDGMRSRYEVIHEILKHRLGVQISRGLRVADERIEFRGKTKAASVHVVIQRLLAQSISGHKQALVRLTPDCKAEHAVEKAQHFVPIFNIGPEGHFCVRVRPETVTTSLQIASYFKKIIYFAVKNNRRIPVFREHRLSRRI